MPIYDFKCTDKDCETVLVDVELSLSQIDEEEFFCPNCGKKMERVLGGMKTKHGSWAEWKLSMGPDHSNNG